MAHEVVIAYNYHPNEWVGSYMAQKTAEALTNLSESADLVDLEAIRTRSWFNHQGWAESYAKNPDSRKKLIHEVVGKNPKPPHTIVFDFHDSNILELAAVGHPTVPFFIQNYWYVTVECPAVYVFQEDPEIAKWAAQISSVKEKGYFTTRSDVSASIDQGLVSEDKVGLLAQGILNFQWRT